MRLGNKTVLISGATGRIGTACAKAVVEAGGRAILGDVDEKKGSELVKLLGKNNSLFMPMDITLPKKIDKVIGDASEIFGPINCAVHCAYPRSSAWGANFENLDLKYLNEDLSLQLGGTLIFSQRMTKHFLSNGGGNLLLLSSIQGTSAPKFEHYSGTQMCSPIEYSAIKAGVISITQYIAKYYQNKNIRSNCLSPGGIIDGQPEVFLRRYRNSCSSKGMLEASDLMASFVFLLSDESKYLNGHNLIVDDGWSL